MEDEPQPDAQELKQDNSTTDIVNLLTGQLAVKDSQIKELQERNRELTYLLGVEQKDRKVYDVIFPKIDTILLDIQLLQKNISIISKTTLTTKTMAQELKIPKHHLDIIFKYYCHYSVNDFSNLIKINYAVLLIKKGYLKKHTVASLGEESLFNSRYTFSQNFKKFIGVSVSEYVTSYR
jgi:AraC-like DNA-binding protein